VLAVTAQGNATVNTNQPLSSSFGASAQLYFGTFTLATKSKQKYVQSAGQQPV